VGHDGAEISTLDLYGRGFVLLAGADGAGWVEAAATLDVPAYRFGVDLQPADGAVAHGIGADGALLCARRLRGMARRRSVEQPGRGARSRAGGDPVALSAVISARLSDCWAESRRASMASPYVCGVQTSEPAHTVDRRRNATQGGNRFSTAQAVAKCTTRTSSPANRAAAASGGTSPPMTACWRSSGVSM
jgi:hypothetical protein